MEVVVMYGCNIQETLKEFKEKARREINTVSEIVKFPK